MTKLDLIKAAAVAAMIAATPAIAKDAEVQLAKCDSSAGTIAITEGDQQGWADMKLESPRAMLAEMIQKSGCFELHNQASGKPADFLMTAVAGSSEEIDKSMNAAKGAITEGLVRSGAAGQLLTKVPMGGALFKAFGGLGGKKKTVMAGLRIMSPMTGQTLISGTGESKKSVLKIADVGDFGGASSGGYSAGDGKMLTAAYVVAFNGIVAQRTVLAAARPVPVVAPAVAATYTVAADAQLWAGPSKTGKPVRALRSGTTLTPTGSARQGVFVEVSDSYGTKGWVSVEDLR